MTAARRYAPITMSVTGGDSLIEGAQKHTAQPHDVTRAALRFGRAAPGWHDDQDKAHKTDGPAPSSRVLPGRDVAEQHQDEDNDKDGTK